jgi:two-component system sensor histidine kinase QseC
MTHSIRKFLLVYISLAVLFITTLSSIEDYYLSQEDVRAHMDALLEQMGLSFAAIISTSLESKNNFNVIETEIEHTQDQSRYLYFVSGNQTRNKFFTQSKYYFQLWDDGGKLLLSSAKLNRLNLDVATTGISDVNIRGVQWRIFKVHDPQNHISYVVGEKYNARDQLLHRIALNNFYSILLVFPVSALLIWLIVGYGFKSLRRITNDISNRAPSYLEPVDTNEVPVEIRPLIEELNSLFARLHDAFEREKRFAGDAAHELRTPLAALKTQVQVALTTTDKEEQNILFQSLIPSVDRLVHIVQQLLTLSRLVPEAARIYDIVDINLSKISAEIIAQLVPSAIEKNIEISLDAPQTVMMKGNLTGLNVLIRNLVDNAIRYTPEKGAVTVEIFEEGDKYVVLRVSDTGPGIPEEMRSRVFERFYRGMGNDTSGSGLGLAIVQQIVHIHHAKVELHSPQKGTGLIMEVKFPKKRSL